MCTTLLALASVVALSACGGSSSSSSSSSSGGGGGSSTTSGGSSGGTITVVAGTAPDSLDPGFGYTTQAAEADWLAYTGLTTYAHAGGVAGGQVIPGLATALPTVSDGGKTYTATLRKGLVFSNGKPVKASDFTFTIERSLKLPWGGSGQFYGGTIVGAKEYAAGKSKTISGITTDDATGKITIHLIAPYGAFDNVLAFPSSGLVPTGTAMKNLPNAPPPGVGPYMITNVVPNASFQLVKNPHWASEAIPGIPNGFSNITVKISIERLVERAVGASEHRRRVRLCRHDPRQPAAADQRAGQGPVLEEGHELDLLHLPEHQGQAVLEPAGPGGRHHRPRSERHEPPRFRHPDPRLLLPAAEHGRSPDRRMPVRRSEEPVATSPRPRRSSSSPGWPAQPVTVWSETRSPRQQWMTYYTQFLNQIGFKATQKVIADATYFTTIGNLKLNPQTGFADWNQDFPNPIDFYLLLQGSAIQPTNNQNFGQVNDPHIDSTSNKLGATPTSQLNSIAGQWQALDQYVAQKAYVAVFGYQTFPAFTSSRIDLSKAIFHGLYGWDFSSLATK